MAISSRFFRVSLALTCLLALSLGGRLISPLQAVAAPRNPLPARPQSTLEHPLIWPSFISPGMAGQSAELLAPCVTRSSTVSIASAALPPVQPVTPKNNPDSTASPPGEVLPGLEDTLTGMVQAGLDDGLSAASVIIKDGATGQVIQVNPAHVFPSASLYKIFVLWKVQVEINAGRVSEES